LYRHRASCRWLDLGSHHEGCNERWHHTLGLQANRCRAVLPFFCHSVLYGIVYGMHKTTVYLPDDLKAAIERTAAETGRSEADLIREGVRLAVAQHTPAPTIPILVSDDPHFAEHVDDHLAGFGER